MKDSSENKVYRVIFVNQGEVYELYVRSVTQGEILGFIEVNGIVFGEKSALLVDPSEDALKKEFEETKSSMIPLHSVIRIDVMEKKGGQRPRVLSLHGGKQKGDAGVPYPSAIPPSHFKS